jgi:hypothetical protein
LYEKVKGAVPDVPVNVISGAVLFWQTDVVPLTVAVGRGLTVTEVVVKTEAQGGTAVRVYVTV